MGTKVNILPIDITLCVKRVKLRQVKYHVKERY
jgi:hypothetical protein